MISWFPKVNLRRLTPDELGRYDPDGLAFWNVNTPEEFAEAEQRAGSSAYLLILPDNKHGAGRVADHFLAVAAKQRARQAAEPA